VILDEASFAKLEEPCEEELDMLDLAIGLQETCVDIDSPAAAAAALLAAALGAGTTADGTGRAAAAAADAVSAA